MSDEMCLQTPPCDLTSGIRLGNNKCQNPQAKLFMRTF